MRRCVYERCLARDDPCACQARAFRRESAAGTQAAGAASALLDRGWGKPQQPHTDEDGDIRVIIRTIAEGAPPMPTCRIPRPAGSFGGGGVVGVGHGHPHHHRQIVEGGRDKD